MKWNNPFSYIEFRFYHKVQDNLPGKSSRSYQAEPSTEWSALSWKIPYCQGALDYLAAYLATYFIIPEDCDYLRFLLLEKIFYLGNRNNWEGRWEVFKTLESLNDLTYNLPDVLESLVENHFSEDDIFGNIVPRVVKYVQNMKLVKQRPKKVRYPQRKRGYSDKGSRREDHKWLPREIHESRVKANNQEREKRIPPSPSTFPNTNLWVPRGG